MRDQICVDPPLTHAVSGLERYSPEEQVAGLLWYTEGPDGFTTFAGQVASNWRRYMVSAARVQ